MLTKVMDYAKEIIGVILLLTVLGVGIGFYSSSTPLVDALSEKNKQQLRQTQDAEYSAFNQRTVSGSHIITAMRRYQTKPVFYIYVKREPSAGNFIANPTKSVTTCRNLDFSTGQLTSGTSNSCSVTLDEMLDETSPYYIQNQSRYHATVLRDENEMVIGLYFELRT